jgi:hypothetical protein
MPANNLFCRPVCYLSKKREFKIYKTILLPVILYALESGFLIKGRT